MQPGDRLKPGGPASRWAPRSQKKTAAGYGRFLTWLDRRDELDPEAVPGAGVSPLLVADYIDSLIALGNAVYTAMCRIEELYDALRVMAPNSTWGWLNDFVAQLRDEVVPSARKRTQLQHVHDLFMLGITLMTEAETTADLTVLEASILYRDGLMIAFCAARAPRIGNFVSLQVGKQLTGDDRGYRVLLRGNETKNGRPIEYHIPAELIPHLECYIGHHRPILLSCGGRYTPSDLDALWISREGTAMAEESLRNVIKR